MLTVGLTGGIACGKSTVAEWIRRQGIPVLDLDQVARQVVAPGEPALAEIGARWPEAVIDGVLDRKKLGALVIVDPGARRELEALTHPRIAERTQQWLAAQAATGATVVVVEAALMVETGSYRRYNKLLVVSAPPTLQRQRLALREGYDPDTVERWLTAQFPLAEKEAVADVVIVNDGSLAELEAHTKAAWARLLTNPTETSPRGGGAPAQ